MGQQTYECPECRCNFQEIEYEDVPDNMSFAVLTEKDKIPKCPKCGHLAFFGFEVVDIAF